MTLGGVVWGYVIGTFCGTIANLSPATHEFRQNMADLNTYVLTLALTHASVHDGTH